MPRVTGNEVGDNLVPIMPMQAFEGVKSEKT